MVELELYFSNASSCSFQYFAMLRNIQEILLWLVGALRQRSLRVVSARGRCLFNLDGKDLHCRGNSFVKFSREGTVLFLVFVPAEGLRHVEILYILIEAGVENKLVLLRGREID